MSRDPRLDYMGAHDEYGKWAAYPREFFPSADAALTHHGVEMWGCTDETALWEAELYALRVRLVWLRPKWGMYWSENRPDDGLIEAWEIT